MASNGNGYVGLSFLSSFKSYNLLRLKYIFLLSIVKIKHCHVSYTVAAYILLYRIHRLPKL